ncbi:MAG TPA: methylisocitrate lyase [Rhodospirillales bacterium]|jgi:methylisocitrate lyase|nr:MAG: 2-methylisocitrate lyase [Alphaproteobacteria bacterium MarineAlpha3_Bin3]HIM42987.1 methylisocitrate lyase [Rhodospirillales bacterium]
MTWLEGNGRDTPPAGERLQALIDRPEILGVPGAHNGLAGMLAKEAGFEALYISGGAVTATLGLPDLGVMTIEELCFITRQVSRSTDLPLIVDGDTGYGEVLNVMRTVKELEHAGAGAVHIEDQVVAKKCGHLNDKRLIPPEDAAAKISAAVKGRSHLRIIARTDAAAVEGLEGAIARANLYKEAGADVVFPDALPSEVDFRTFADSVPGPKMANMTEFGRTPYFTAEQFQDMGYDIVIWPATSMRVAAGAMQELYAHIRDHGGAEALIDKMPSRAELYETIGYYDYEALDEGIAKSVVPETPGE